MSEAGRSAGNADKFMRRINAADVVSVIRMPEPQCVDMRNQFPTVSEEATGRTRQSAACSVRQTL